MGVWSVTVKGLRLRMRRSFSGWGLLGGSSGGSSVKYTMELLTTPSWRCLAFSVQQKIGVNSELSLITKNNSSFGKWGLILSLTYWSLRNLSYWVNLNFLETLLPQSKCGIFVGAYFSLVGIMLFWIKIQPTAFTNLTNPVSVKFKSPYVISSIMRITTETLLHAWRSGVNSCVRSQLAWSKTFRWSWENVDMVNGFMNTSWGKKFTFQGSRDGVGIALDQQTSLPCRVNFVGLHLMP